MTPRWALLREVEHWLRSCGVSKSFACAIASKQDNAVLLKMLPPRRRFRAWSRGLAKRVDTAAARLQDIAIGDLRSRYRKTRANRSGSGQ